MRRRVIGVMGGAHVDERVRQDARVLGSLIAQRGWAVLCGGRNVGVMAAVAEGAKESGGWVVGVLPDADSAQSSPHLDFAVVTGMGDGRNIINVLSSDAIIACPGGPGTLSEIALALKNHKPLVLLGWRRDTLFRTYAPELDFADTPDEAISKIAVHIGA